jgi:uncharacterized membrane protein YdjX (TVP38/TMEM64 family)
MIGKFASDAVVVFMGKYAAENTSFDIDGIISVKSEIGLVFAILLLFAFLFIDWWLWVQEKKFRINFKI